MRLLLDSHAMIYSLDDVTQLGLHARGCLESSESSVWFSLISLWELAIKSSTGKLKLSSTLNQMVGGLLAQGFGMIPITVEHCQRVQRLPFHHRDPFDRMLAALAQAE